jgi:hypothetical protein
MSSGSQSSIQIPPGDDGQSSISHDHLEVTVTRDGRYLIRDLGSANGTFLRENYRWIPLLNVAETTLDAPLRLGGYETTLAALLADAPEPSVEADIPPPPPVERPKAHGCCMIRCVCGSMKQRSKPCRHCGHP